MLGRMMIGILGVTPDGAAKAYKDLCHRCYKKYGKYNNPDIILHTQPLIRHRESFGKRKEWAALIQEGINLLLNAGADIIWMPANSSHLVASDIDFGHAKFLNMVDISVAHIEGSKTKTLVLGTDVSVSNSLYFQTKMMRDKALRVDSADQAIVNAIILDELIVGGLTDQSRRKIIEIVRRYQEEQGVERLFLACTELPCFFSAADFSLPVNDSIQTVIDTLITPES